MATGVYVTFFISWWWQVEHSSTIHLFFSWFLRSKIAWCKELPQVHHENEAAVKLTSTWIQLLEVSEIHISCYIVELFCIVFVIFSLWILPRFCVKHLRTLSTSMNVAQLNRHIFAGNVLCPGPTFGTLSIVITLFDVVWFWSCWIGRYLLGVWGKLYFDIDWTNLPLIGWPLFDTSRLSVHWLG